METLLKISNLHIYYGSIQALKGISLDVAKGEIVSVLGANGAGKSTLLRAKLINFITPYTMEYPRAISA